MSNGYFTHDNGTLTFEGRQYTCRLVQNGIVEELTIIVPPGRSIIAEYHRQRAAGARPKQYESGSRQDLKKQLFSIRPDLEFSPEIEFESNAQLRRRLILLKEFS